MAAIGHGGLKEGQIINRMLEAYEKDHKRLISDSEILSGIQDNAQAKHLMHRKSKSGILVKGVDDVAVRFSKCCNPVPGDDILGYVTRGRGVSIHRTDCINMLNLSEFDRQRIIEADWEETDSKEKFPAEINIYANNRNGLLADVSKALTERNIDILSLNTRTNKQGLATMSISFETSGKEELKSIMDRIRNIESIVDIERT